MHRHLRQQLPTSVVNSVGWHLQLKENRRSPGSQKQLTEEVIYESFVGLENISVNNTTTIPPPLSLPESDIVKDMETVLFAFFTLRLLVSQIIVRLFRFQLLLVMIWDSLTSTFIRMETLVLGQQKLEVLQSHQENCFVMRG